MLPSFDVAKLYPSKLLLCILQKLIVKPDQLIKRRGKLGLIKTNATLADVKQWIDERIGKEFAVSASTHGEMSLRISFCSWSLFISLQHLLRHRRNLTLEMTSDLIFYALDL